MTTYVFVPLTDELLFNNPEKIRGPLVPYNPASVTNLPETGQQPCGAVSAPAETRQHVKPTERQAHR